MWPSKKYARFVGRDDSCGLRKMKVYCIEIAEHPKKDWANYRVFVNGLGIPYDTKKAIEKNWKILFE